jgi:hypothetical protein
MRQFIIYRITFPTGQFYIGQTYSHEYERWGNHLTLLKFGKHGNLRMQEIYNEYGYDDFVFEILIKDTSDDKAYVNILEKHLVGDHPNTINYHDGRKTDKQLEEHLLMVRKIYNKKHKYGGKQLYQKDYDEIIRKEAKRKYAREYYHQNNLKKYYREYYHKRKKTKELSTT